MWNMKVFLNGKLTIKDVINGARHNAEIAIAPECLEKIKISRAVVENIVKSKKVVYGITTGFGKFADVSISENDCKQLQKNLILSHACGVGDPFPIEVVRAMMMLRINALSIGNSGISQETLDMLVTLYNKNIIPLVPGKGSLGASGDLAPLAHMVLPMFGVGEVYYKGKRMAAADALKAEGLEPIELTAKEGLALINGTQAMNSLAVLSVYDAENLIKTGDIVACMTIEALRGVTDAYDPRIHEIRNQRGQIYAAANLRKILSGSKRTTKQGELRVQDSYTLRCIPQVHGTVKDSFGYIKGIVSNEINAVTDNPLIFPDTAESFSGGNFHGQYLSMAMDYMAISMSTLAGISERRTERLVNPQLSNGLPAFLVKNGGLNSGFMIPQYVAAALVSENKVLSHPAGVDSITSSANQEDFVSMGMTAARKARQIIENVTNILAIELLTACQAIDFGKEELSPATAAVYKLVREKVEFIENDKYMAPEIEACAELIRAGKLTEVVEKITGELLL
ncbi:histidine ammonia-lyase [Holotrichia oblita]|nr:histidine ammonia-lyase [Holotrichia oblita]